MARKTLRVSLNTNLNPAVRVDPVVYGTKKMRFKPHKKSSNFTFADIQFPNPNSPFNKKSLKSDEIKVDNGKNSGDWEYILTVIDDQGQPHTSTTAGGPPAGGKPVIRN
jgi:hypothetical protein